MKKHTIFFDLDHTLVHTAENDSSDFDFEVSVKQANNNTRVFKVVVRPFAEELLNKLSSHFRLMIFTASKSQYADPIIDKIDPNKHIEKRYYRQHCVFKKQSFFCKILGSIDGVDLKNTVIVDDLVSSFYANLSNGVPLLPFFGNKKDDQLRRLSYFLMSLKSCDDVRQVISERFTWEVWKQKFGNV